MLRIVGGQDVSPVAFGPLAMAFRGIAPVDDLSAGIAPAHSSAGTHAVTMPDTVDHLRFGSLPAAEAVSRINVEYFVLRSSGAIYRLGDTGELNAVSKQNFRTALGGRWIEFPGSDGKARRRPAADEWLESDARREFIGLQYSPNGIGLRRNHLNLFTGWGEVAPSEGDCSIIVQHLVEIVADANHAKGEYLLNWLADILQNPTRKPGVVPVLRGGQGSGKSVIAAIMRRVLGAKNVLTTSDKDRILGRFNSAVANKILLVGEEMLFAGDRATTDKLKHLITGQTLPIEIKFGDTIEIESHHRLLLTSNHEQVVQAAGEERRFVTYDVSDARRRDADYFDRLYAVADGRDDATAAGFMRFLLDRDLSAFNPWKDQQAFRADPALIRQKEMSLSPPLLWLRELLEVSVGQIQPAERHEWLDGMPVSSVPIGSPRECKWPTRFSRKEAIDAFRAWSIKSRPYGVAEFTASPPRFWAEIGRVIPHVHTSVKDSAGNRGVSIDFAHVQANFRKFLQGESV